MASCCAEEFVYSEQAHFVFQEILRVREDIAIQLLYQFSRIIYKDGVKDKKDKIKQKQSKTDKKRKRQVQVMNEGQSQKPDQPDTARKKVKAQN
ncbi:hypothetical protein Tco_1027856 [Tanacetum coccineum]